MRGAALLLALLPLGAAAETVQPYPPSTCAALWEGYADSFGDDGERALAQRFRLWSAELIGAAETDALVAERRPWVRDLVAAYVVHRDKQSGELFQRLVAGCGEMAANLPDATPGAPVDAPVDAP